MTARYDGNNYNCQSGRLLPLITVRTSYLFIAYKNVASSAELQG